MTPNPPCGGITVQAGKAVPTGPRCCEVHLLPWGHDRADLGFLHGTVQPDPTPTQQERP